MVTLDTLKEKEVIVYGTGLNAVKCVRFLEERRIRISYILDGQGSFGRFKDYPVYTFSEELLKGKYIVIACSEETYGTIKDRLCKCGEFKDFIFYSWLDKKIVFLHGNCHMDIVEAFLKSSKKFQREFVIYPMPRVCEGKTINTDILANMDIWIHEDIRSNNTFGYEVSDEYLRQFMGEDVIEIIIPHLYGLGGGFFPYAKEWNHKSGALLNGAYIGGMFRRQDDLIEQCIETGVNVEQICRHVLLDNIIPSEEIQDNFNAYINKIRERENAWDIKILDFILKHYKYEKLFYDDGHPTNVIMKKISEDILHLLGISDRIWTDMKMDNNEIPIYPWVQKVLGMEWREENIRTGEMAIKCKDFMDIAEYVREYIWWCHPEFDKLDE